jgi:hypothetical protein
MNDAKPFIEVLWMSELGRQVRIGNWLYIFFADTGEHDWQWVEPDFAVVEK